MYFWKGRRLSEGLAIMALGFIFMVPSDPLYAPKGIEILDFPFFSDGKADLGSFNNVSKITELVTEPGADSDPPLSLPKDVELQKACRHSGLSLPSSGR